MARVKSAALVVLAAAVTVVGGLLLRPAEARQGGAPAARPQAAAAPRVEAPGAKPAPDADDRTRRVRELIYFFRDYRVFSRDEEWAQTIRELATIGKDAVPELVAELDRTDRDATLRSLAFSPPRDRRPAGRAGADPGDPEGAAPAWFRLRRHHRRSGPAERSCRPTRITRRTGNQHVACGRPVNEILSALERITGHREPPDVGEDDPLRHVFLGEDPRSSKPSSGRCSRNVRSAGRRGGRSTGRNSSPRRNCDRSSCRSATRTSSRWPASPDMGCRFPTGARRCGSARSACCGSPRAAYWDGKSHLDFDTGRGFSEYEGMKTADWGQGDGEFGSAITRWHRQNRDRRPLPGPSRRRRPATLAGGRQPMGYPRGGDSERRAAAARPGSDQFVGHVSRSSRTDFKPDELATFLFTTREGGRGIVQVFPKDTDADRYRLRYRMWSTAAGRANRLCRRPRSRARRRPAERRSGRSSPTTLERPAAGRASLLDLETGRKRRSAGLPEARTVGNRFPSIRISDSPDGAGTEGSTCSAFVETAEVEAAAPAQVAKEAAPASRTVFGLIGLDMVEARILPQSFDEMTVEEAREILGRMPRNEIPHRVDAQSATN